MTEETPADLFKKTIRRRRPDLPRNTLVWMNYNNVSDKTAEQMINRIEETLGKNYEFMPLGGKTLALLVPPHVQQLNREMTVAKLFHDLDQFCIWDCVR